MWPALSRVLLYATTLKDSQWSQLILLRILLRRDNEDHFETCSGWKKAMPHEINYHTKFGKEAQSAKL